MKQAMSSLTNTPARAFVSDTGCGKGAFADGPRRAGVLALLLASLALGASAQEGSDGPSESTEASREAAESPAPEQEPPAAQAPERNARPDEEDVFIPSEEIAADEEVTFPVDI